MKVTILPSMREFAICLISFLTFSAPVRTIQPGPEPMLAIFKSELFLSESIVILIYENTYLYTIIRKIMKISILWANWPILLMKIHRDMDAITTAE